jgi:hypothetical protein
MTRAIDARLTKLENVLAPEGPCRIVWANSKAEAASLAASLKDSAGKTIIYSWADPDPAVEDQLR